MERNVLHLNLLDFPVAVEGLRDPSLRGRPVVIAWPGPRGRVLWASAEARREGVRPGLVLGEAERLCGGVVLPPSRRLYERAQERLLLTLGRYSPVVEPVGLGRFFVDLSGMGRLLGPARDGAYRIGQELSKEGPFPYHLGLSSNKSTSQVASTLHHEGLIEVFPGSEATFLSPQEAQLLPGAERIPSRMLGDLNIRIIHQFATLPVAQLTLVFGRLGALLHLRARGHDPRPVRPPEQGFSIFEEATLGEDSNDRGELLEASRELVERCGRRLRMAQRAAGAAELAVEYSDHRSNRARERIVPTTNTDSRLFATIRGLFERLVQRRVRVKHQRVAFGELVCQGGQMSLLAERRGEPREAALVRAMDGITARFGAGAIGRASALLGSQRSGANLSRKRPGRDEG